jgi:hypothetical protein
MEGAALCVPVSESTPLVSLSVGAVLYMPYAVFLLFNGKWESLVARPMAEKHANGSAVAACYLVLVMVNGLHMVALLKLLRHTDAIVAGVNKAVQVCPIARLIPGCILADAFASCRQYPFLLRVPSCIVTVTKASA